MGRGPVVLPVRIGTCLWLLGRQLCLRSHHDGADGNPSLYRGLAAFAHRKPAPASSASQFRQFALVHRVKMSSRNDRFRDQHSAREMTALRAQSCHISGAINILPTLHPHIMKVLVFRVDPDESKSLYNAHRLSQLGPRRPQRVWVLTLVLGKTSAIAKRDWPKP